MADYAEQSIAQTWYNLRFVIYGIIALLLSVVHVVFLNLVSGTLYSGLNVKSITLWSEEV